MIVNKQAREFKISMLITKPFALGDDTIRKKNDQVAKQAFKAQGYNSIPVAKLPRTSFMKDNELKGADVERFIKERDLQDLMDPLDLKVQKGHGKSQPPLIRKKRARRSDSLDRIETSMIKQNEEKIRSSQVTEQRNETSAASMQT